jgi:hypothetical protein
MRHVLGIALGACCFLPILAAPPLACDPYFTICVTVRDCASQALLEGAYVRFLWPPSDGHGTIGDDGVDTDSAGRCCAEDLGGTSPPDGYQIDATKAGYREAVVTFADGRGNPDVCLSACDACDASGDGGVD